MSKVVKTLEGLSLLLVEDNEADCILFQDAIRIAAPPEDFPEGIKIAIAHTINQADEMLSTKHYDCVLLDMYLPDSDALEGLNYLVHRYPHIPFLIYSGIYSRELAIESIELGAQDFLVKQYSSPELIVRAIVHAILRQKTVYAVKQFVGSANERGT